MGASKTKEVKAEASSAQSKKGMFLRERDIDLLSYVAAARFLSTRQIQQLVFPDGAIQNVDARLLQLGPGRDTEKAALRGAALLQAVPFSRLNGVRVRAWGITQRGARETEARLGYSAEVMNNSVGEAFRNQAVVTNELFVQLLQVGPCNPRIVKFREGSVRGGGLHSPSNYFAENLRCFRWTPLGQARLHWTELKPGAPEERFIEPDAILEVPKAKRRFFIEQEVGGLDVVDEKRTVESVAVRLQRYATFLTEFADSDRKLTHVRAQYPDRFTPEVVFIAPSPRRRDELRADVELWKTRNPTMHFAIRCQIVSEAAQDLGQLIYGAALRAAGGRGARTWRSRARSDGSQGEARGPRQQEHPTRGAGPRPGAARARGVKAQDRATSKRPRTYSQ